MIPKFISASNSTRINFCVDLISNSLSFISVYLVRKLIGEYALCTRSKVPLT